MQVKLQRSYQQNAGKCSKMKRKWWQCKRLSSTEMRHIQNNMIKSMTTANKEARISSERVTSSTRKQGSVCDRCEKNTSVEHAQLMVESVIHVMAIITLLGVFRFKRQNLYLLHHEHCQALVS
ncbi:hypothetical protein PR048_017843 [Dryococelus australis]|uniref:Uncharacterized protein n=1 Tax=Dryococelus australis TaxID=614101 RepID=A0ABQ9HAR0_9NEOP|nr:hypothetical protein PR048_017843 [Dryococelus australis]